RILLAAAGRPARPLEVVAFAQREAAHLAEGDVDVLGAGEVARRAQESVALVTQVEQALDGNGLALELRLLAAPLLEVAVAALAVATPAPAAAAIAGLSHPTATTAAELLLAPVAGRALVGAGRTDLLQVRPRRVGRLLSVGGLLGGVRLLGL